MKNYRLEPARTNGLWHVEIATGNRKKGTRRAFVLTGDVYTLAQAQVFCSNNRTAEFIHHLDNED